MCYYYFFCTFFTGLLNIFAFRIHQPITKSCILWVFKINLFFSVASRCSLLLKEETQKPSLSGVPTTNDDDGDDGRRISARPSHKAYCEPSKKKRKAKSCNQKFKDIWNVEFSGMLTSKNRLKLKA